MEFPRRRWQYVARFEQRLEVGEHRGPALPDRFPVGHRGQVRMSDSQFDDVAEGLDIERDDALLGGRIIAWLAEAEDQPARRIDDHDGAGDVDDAGAVGPDVV